MGWRILLAGVACLTPACGSRLHSKAVRETMDNTLGLYATVLEKSQEIPVDVKIKAAQVGVYIGEAVENETSICPYYYTLESLKTYDIYDLTKAATYLQDGLRLVCDLPPLVVDRTYE